MHEHEAEIVIDRAAGRVEIRGPANFVKEMWTKAQEFQMRALPPDASVEKSASGAKESSSGVGRKAVRKSAGIPQTTPFDIKGAGGLSLAKLRDEKKPPNNHDSLITFFTYYGAKHSGLEGVTAGHLMYCYEQLGIKKPGNIYAAMNNARGRGKKVVTGPGSNTLAPNVAGENWVKFELPPKPESTK